MPNRQNKKTILKRPLSASEKNYIIWLISSLSVIIIITICLCIYGISVYRRAVSLFNSTNEKIIQKTGLEVTADINSSAVTRVEEIIDKKNNTSPIPEKARNIFFYNSYIYLDQKPVSEIIMTTSSEPAENMIN